MNRPAYPAGTRPQTITPLSNIMKKKSAASNRPPRPGITRRKSAKSAPVISPEQVAEVLKLVKKANSVELKLSVPLTEHRATIKGLGLDPVEAQPRQVFFYDTPDLALNQAGLVVRARRIQGGSGDTVIKLRPVDPATIDAELRRSAAFKIEVDVMPGGFVCSASFKGACSNRDVLDVATGKQTLKTLFSKEQRAFYDEHAPAGIALNSLVTLGPTFVLKSRHQPKDFDHRIVVEMWFYPDGSRILEISTKSLPDAVFQVAAEFKAHLTDCGIAIEAAQETKTRAALDYFRARLDPDRPADAPSTD